MSIQSEIDRIKGNIAGAYTAVSDLGGDVPIDPNSANLPEAIRTIPVGGQAREWSQLADVDLSEISGGSIELTGLDHYTDFYILWDTPKNASETTSGFTLIINGMMITAVGVVPISNKNKANPDLGWTRVNYDGLVWNVQRSGGSSSTTNMQLTSANANYPYNHVLGVGAAESFQISTPVVPDYRAVSGAIKVYGR